MRWEGKGVSPAADRPRSELSGQGRLAVRAQQRQSSGDGRRRPRVTAKWVGHTSYVLPKSGELTYSDSASRDGNELVFAVPGLQPGHKKRIW